MLFVSLLERMSVIALAAYIFSQSVLFKRILKYEVKVFDKLIMVVFFSLLSILGTYMGINVEPGAIANIRPIGAIAAGYLGGPVIGMLVGLIAGTQRYFMGGFTALSCGLSTIFEGLIGGLAKKVSKDGTFSAGIGFVSGIIAEVAQMIIILLISRPYSKALELERIIAYPMIIVNSIGVAAFINIINNCRQEYTRAQAVQSQRVLDIIKRITPHIRKGLDIYTASNITEIIYEIGEISGVFIGDRNQLLAYHGDDIQLEILEMKLKDYYIKPFSGTISFKSNSRDTFFYCVPLLTGKNEFEGVLGFKAKHKTEIDEYFMEFSRGIGELLSNQIELYKLNIVAHEASTAELKALRAQVHPHFLFNALNTIASFCRTNPLKARELILDLANYFRKTLKKEADFVPLSEEIELIQSYLAIEKARYSDRLKVFIDIPSDLVNMKVPPFVIQPLIENSIKHGISPKPKGGSIYIRCVSLNDKIMIEVMDTGVGMTEERCSEVKSQWPGIGLRNVNERLKLMYGDACHLNIESSKGKGTTINFVIPKEEYLNEQTGLYNS